MNKLERKIGWKREYLLEGKPFLTGFYLIEDGEKTFRSFVEVTERIEKLPGYGNRVNLQDIKIGDRTLKRKDIDTLKFKRT